LIWFRSGEGTPSFADGEPPFALHQFERSASAPRDEWCQEDKAQQVPEPIQNDGRD
jgi:hypothetical protein